MAESNYALSLHRIPDRLQALSRRLHIDPAIRNNLDGVVQQAVQCAGTFGRTLKENTEQLYIQGELLRQAKKPKEVKAKDLEKTLKQTRTSIDSTRTEICTLQLKVHSLIEDCRGQVNAHKQETVQKRSRIETTKREICHLKDKIIRNEEDAKSLDRCAGELDDRAQYLKREAEKKKEQGLVGGLLSAVVGIVFAPFTGGVSLIAAAAAGGITVGVNFNDASNCEKEASSCRDGAYEKRRTANSLKDDVTRMNSDIDTLETEIVRLEERIGMLEDAISALEDVKKMLLSSVGASDDVVDAIEDMDTVLKETLLARSGFLTSLKARAESVAERQLDNLKASWARVQKAMENNRRYALQN